MMLDNKDMLKRWYIMKGRYKFSRERAIEIYREMLKSKFRPNLP